MMNGPTYEEFAAKQGLENKSQEKGKVELLMISKCPTPGCSGRKVRPNMKLGRLEGFTCEAGCDYRTKRNKFTGEIDYFELVHFNQYRIDTGYDGYRVKPDGTPNLNWF